MPKDSATQRTRIRKPGTPLLVPSCVMSDNTLLDLINTMTEVKENLRDEPDANFHDFDCCSRDIRHELEDMRGREILLGVITHDLPPRFYFKHAL